jgi:hypothetical protein
MMAVGLPQEAERSLTIPLDSQEEITVAPALSTARYKYFLAPLTLTCVSSIASWARPHTGGSEIPAPASGHI